MPNATGTRMPAAFLGHGSPMNAIETNRYTEAWAALGSRVPRPRAILVVSAHWFVPGTAVTAMARPVTIHDFRGFPQSLFAIEYPAPGDEHLAEEIAELAQPTRVALDRDGWGLDHGAWSLLVHAFPAADVPVVQLSIHSGEDMDYHLELGARLAPLRDRGVLIVGSGNLVHNLSALDGAMPDAGFDWARRFDDAARAVLMTRPWDMAVLQSHPDYSRAVPTPEHFLPALYVAGLASVAKAPLDVLVTGYDLGSLSMTAYTLNDGAAR